MNIQDKKEMRLAIGEVFEEVILPVIQDVKDDVSGLKDDVSTLKDDVSDLKNDVAILKDDVSELKTDMESVENHLDRIERKQDAEIERNDNLSQMVEKHDKILIKLNKA